MQKSKYRNNKDEKELTIFSILKGCLPIIAFFYIFAIILILASSLFAYKSENSFEIMNVISKASLIFSALISGLIISMKNGNKQILSGLVLGVTIIFTFFIISLFTKSDSGQSTILWYGITLTACTAGSILGIYTKTNKPKRRKHKHK